MSPKRRSASGLAKPSADLEWICGRVVLPQIHAEVASLRPEMILWLESPSGFIVASDVHDSTEAVSLADSFFRAARAPLQGKPRRPRRVRVATKALAGELAPVALEGVEVCVAPTPEIEILGHELARRFSGAVGAANATEDASASYFEGGRISEQTVAAMFAAAHDLYAAAPWKTMYDGQVLRLDIPQHDVAGACVSIIGNLGEAFGILIFPGLDAFETFGERSQRRAMRKGRIDLGSTLLSLEFDPSEDIPAGMRWEVEEHGWPVAGPWAYPCVQHRNRDGTPKRLTERDFQVATACARALVTFYLRNEPLLDPEIEEIEPVSMTVEADDAVRVRFTYPYEAYDAFEPERMALMPSPVARKTGRNDPCPCGSGKKYKKCHFEADERVQQRTARHSPANEPAPIHTVDERLVDRMMHWARPRFGAAMSRNARLFRQPAAALQMLVPWCVYGAEVDGRPIVAHFLQDPDVALTGDERRWLEAQQRAWLSVWEVQQVESGKWVELLDLLTGEKRRVLEVSGSQTLVRFVAILGRVVDDEDVAVLCGVHPQPLPPQYAAAVVKRARSWLRLSGDVAAARIRNADFGRRLIEQWEKGAARFERDRKRPLLLRNTDGDHVLYTVDRYGLDPRHRDAIATRLASIDGVQDSEEGAEGALTYVVVKPGNKMHESWESTIIGRLVLAQDSLAVETNSTKRANDLRRHVESACGEWIRDRRREEVDQTEMQARAHEADREEPESAPPPPELAEVMREEKQRFYEAWFDERIPALGGKTPRQAARLARRRSEVDLLLKEMEYREARLPASERVDFTRIRAQLGL